MAQQTIVLPITTCSKQRTYPPAIFSGKEYLQTALHNLGLNITLGETLKGGVVSQIYEANLDGKRVVVKHTENLIPFDPTEIFIDRRGHNIDTKVLKLLSKSGTVRVPKVLYHFPKITTTVMEDLRQDGFVLLNPLLLRGELPENSAASIGKALANLVKESGNWKPFMTNESAQESIYERGLELRLCYPNSQKQYLALEKEFTEHNEHWVWPDGHPKNMFVKPNRGVAFIDFGRSHWGDQRYMLPNFLAHIVMYTLAGYVDPVKTKSYISNCVAAYRNLEPFDEILFCRYLAMEVLHRCNGKWVDGIEKREQKVKLYNFGLTVFDDNIDTVEKLLGLL